MTARDARTIAQFLLSDLRNEVGLTTAVFGAVPPNRLDYRPDPLTRSALGLLRHIVLEDEWMLNAVADGQFAPLPDDSDACGLMTPSDAIASYNERIRRAIARIEAMPDEALTREVDLFGMIKMPAVGFLSLMIRHSVHHRGQLSTYLRTMGGKVPSIYGPTAEMQKAAATA